MAASFAQVELEAQSLVTEGLDEEQRRGLAQELGELGAEELEELLAQDLSLAKAKAASEGLRRLAGAGMLLRSDSEEVWEEYVEEEEQNFEPEPEEPEPEPRSEFAEEEGQSRVFDPGRTTSCV